MDKQALLDALLDKEFHGTIHRLKKAEITWQQAENELNGDNSHIKPPVYKELDPYELARELKQQGVERSLSWTRYVQRTALRPKMDAKVWYAIYDSV